MLIGIHGYPTIPWDGAPGNANWGWGYCTHDSQIFPTWHRPYVALYEASLSSIRPGLSDGLIANSLEYGTVYRFDLPFLSETTICQCCSDI